MNATFIRRALLVLLALVVAALAGLALSFFQLQRASSALSEAESNRVLSYQLAMELRQSSDDLTRLARAAVATGDPEYERQYNTVLAIRNGELPRPTNYHHVYWDLVDPERPAKPRADTPDLTPLHDRMQKAGFAADELELVTQSEQNSGALAEKELVALNMAKGKFKNPQGEFLRLGPIDRDSALKLVFGNEYQREKATVMRPLEQFFVKMEQRLNTAVSDATTGQFRAQVLFVSMIALSLALIGALIYFGRKQSRMDLAERALAQKKAEEENEQLNNSVISVLQAVNELSQRDLTVKAPVTEDVIGTVSASINALADETSRVLHGVTTIAGQVEQVSGNVKSQADLVTQTADNERASVAQMVDALLDATQTMNQVAALAEQSNDSAEKATVATDNALGTVNDTVKGMEAIRETIAETEKRIKRLGERSQEISGIVNLINTISERTHVLALNASMQAAVAGEAGRGFAVVAEEVQRLAESSRNATQQIGTLVNNIQQETNETISTVNRTIGQVVEGSEQAQKAGEQMRQTQEITGQLVAQVRSIAHASEQQKAMSAQLLEAVQKIGESTDQTAQQIEAQNKETDTLLDAARRLVESVSVFKLPASV
ncbi:MAG: methyl-accepting chemotaxis protein [Pseudomonadota bacterium]|nr:methyl-accepting chemotaxis protein [Pseudomonadota bacterium]